MTAMIDLQPEQLKAYAEQWKAYADIAAVTATAIIGFLVYVLNRRQHDLQRQDFRLHLLELRRALILKLRAAEFDVWYKQKDLPVPDIRQLTAEVREIAFAVDLLYGLDIAGTAADIAMMLKNGDWNEAVLDYARGPNSKARVSPKQLKLSDAGLRGAIEGRLWRLEERMTKASRIDERYL